MEKIRVYSDMGGFIDAWRALEQEGKISLHQFKYENRNKKIRGGAIPSNLRYLDFQNFTHGELNRLNPDGLLTYGQLCTSIGSMLNRILEIVGTGNLRDAQPLDSARMTKCKVFLTSDKNDIWSNKKALFSLTGAQIFLMPTEWNDFLSYIG